MVAQLPLVQLCVRELKHAGYTNERLDNGSVKDTIGSVGVVNTAGHSTTSAVPGIPSKWLLGDAIYADAYAFYLSMNTLPKALESLTISDPTLSSLVVLANKQSDDNLILLCTLLEQAGPSIQEEVRVAVSRCTMNRYHHHHKHHHHHIIINNTIITTITSLLSSSSSSPFNYFRAKAEKANRRTISSSSPPLSDPMTATSEPEIITGDEPNNDNDEVEETKDSIGPDVVDANTNTPINEEKTPEENDNTTKPLTLTKEAMELLKKEKLQEAANIALQGIIIIIIITIIIITIIIIIIIIIIITRRRIRIICRRDIEKHLL